MRQATLTKKLNDIETRLDNIDKFYDTLISEFMKLDRKSVV